MQLYVHIPYCRQKCRYCDFASYPCQEETMSSYVDALLKEASTVSRLIHQPLTTGFIGGGTPSILPAPLLDRLLNGLQNTFDFTADMEFTTEANPGTLTADWLHTAMAGGVNRLSMGMQAVQPDLLQTLGRIHTHEEVVESVHLAHREGIHSLNLDLMFGLPGQTPDMWRETLQAALALEPEHLSCYGLIPEVGTPLFADLQSGRLTLPDEDDERRMYDDALELLARHGYQQYEISNFARPGAECRHNIGYWQQQPYIGLGASAASMVTDMEGELRMSNPPSIADYIHMVQHRQWAKREFVRVTQEDARFETLMLGLRMTQGVSEADFLQRHRVPLESYRGTKLKSLQEQGLLEHTNGFWRLTRRGMDVQNAILVELMDD
ncbi:MAG: radical SAM family heme chaperone HemW [Clostridia bacterium]|nr:radical SAM family heme chaperone HemW [Clostridia bacterium]